MLRHSSDNNYVSGYKKISRSSIQYKNLRSKKSELNKKDIDQSSNSEEIENMLVLRRQVYNGVPISSQVNNDNDEAGRLSI